jgi:ATP-dependent Clp protease ATP-binding subunit ClpC
VGPQHILLALFVEPAGLAGRALAAMNVSEDAVRAAISADTRARPQGTGARAEGTSASPQGASAGPEDTSDPRGKSADATPAFDSDAKEALRDALTVALAFGHNYIGTEHLLLGLYKNPGNTAAGILIDAGALEATARAHVADMLRGTQEAT